MHKKYNNKGWENISKLTKKKTNLKKITKVEFGYKVNKRTFVRYNRILTIINYNN